MAGTEKETPEGKLLKTVAKVELIAGGSILLITGSVVGLLVLGSGGFKYWLIKRSEGRRV
jgi:hypothetical protein